MEGDCCCDDPDCQCHDLWDEVKARLESVKRLKAQVMSLRLVSEAGNVTLVTGTVSGGLRETLEKSVDLDSETLKWSMTLKEGDILASVVAPKLLETLDSVLWVKRITNGMPTVTSVDAGDLRRRFESAYTCIQRLNTLCLQLTEHVREGVNSLVQQSLATVEERAKFISAEFKTLEDTIVERMKEVKEFSLLEKFFMCQIAELTNEVKRLQESIEEYKSADDNGELAACAKQIKSIQRRVKLFTMALQESQYT